MRTRGEASPTARGGGGAPPPVKKRLRPCRAEDMRIRGEASAIARGGGGAPPPVKKNLGPAREERMFEHKGVDVRVESVSKKDTMGAERVRAPRESTGG